jgi:parallel beta-helix repeat protein
MNTHKNLQLFSTILRGITVITLVLTNFVGMIPVRNVQAQDEIIDIYDDVNGGECSLVGNWDNDTKTCQLMQDVYVTVTLGSDITLNGNGYSIIGPWQQDTRAIVLVGENITIRNVNVRDFGYCMFSGYQSHYLTVTDSTFERCEMGLFGNNMWIEGNHISGGEGRGIELQGSNNSILRNVITDNSQGGILMYESDNNLISENDIQNTTENSFFYGMWVQWSDGNIIENNNIQGYYSSGINIDFSASNTIRNNLISGATYGLNVSRQSTSNVIYGNTVQGNWLPLTIGESTDNWFYDNDFIDNGDWIWVQPGNFFQLDLPVGGNYWSSFDNWFEGCFDLNMDGLCDSPYIFDGGQDDLPWTRPDKSINQTPVANAGGIYTTSTGDSITLDASASSDPDGDALTYEWDLDNDGLYNDATGVTVTTTFSQAGEYTVGLRVTDMLGLEGTDTAIVTVTDHTPNGSFAAHLPGNQVHAYNWTAGSTLTLTIDDPEIPGSPDFQGAEVVPDNDLYGNTWTVFELPDFELKPGQTMTITDSITTKTHVIRTVAVTSVNPDTDIITGTAEPNTEVGINAHYDPGGDYVHRNIISDENGNWTVNLSVPGPNPGEERIYDIVRGSWGTAFQWDEDNDSTFYGWQVPDPTISARLPDNAVRGDEWSLGSSVTLTIDDPTTYQPIDYTDTRTVGIREWDPGQTEVWFDLNNYILEPGQVLTMTDGTVTNVHTVIDLKITDVNINTDVVSGVTNVLEGEIQIYSFGYPATNRIINVNPDGTWLADFSVPHSSQNKTSDLRPGDVSEALHYDEDGDFTLVRWRVPNPTFSARYHENEIHGYEWPLGALVNMTIDDPDNGAGADYTDTQTVIVADWDPNQTFVQFRLWENGFTLENGMTVSMSDGMITKTHTVTDLIVTAVDHNADTVSGTASPDSQVDVGHIFCDENGCRGFRRVFADSNGDWIADFAHAGEDDDEQDIIDITPGMGNEARQCDDDGDCTQYGWYVLNPYFFVDFAGDHVYAFQWQMGAMVTVTIDDPATSNVDFTQTLPVRTDNPWSSETWIDFQSTIPFKTGLIITMTDGDTVKTHAVTDLTITEANPETDTVSGTATPGSLVRVWIHDPVCCIMRHVIADENGRWVADYSMPGDEDFENETFDLQWGNSGQASQPDEDEDATNKPWRVPDYTLHAVPTHPEVHGHDWSAGADVTLTIDNDTNPTNGVLYTRTKNADDDPWCGYPCFDLYDVFDLQVGQYVTMTDGAVTKTVLVSVL